MTAFKNLTRVHSWILNEKQQKLAGIVELVDKMKADLKRLEAEIDSENRAAADSIEGTVAFPAFVAAALERRRRLRQTIAELEQSIDTVREEVRAAFEEMKKYERAAELEERQKSDERARREQVEQDETSTIKFQREQAVSQD